MTSETLDTKIAADSIIVDSDQILHATGKVTVQHGKNKIRANALKFYRKSNEIKFKEMLEFYDGKTIKLSAEEALIKSDLTQGTIRKANLLLDDTIKIQADEVRLENGEISSANGISRVTSCDECEGKKPNWYLAASSAERDFENSNVIYKNVSVWAKGLPVAYIPYLRTPDPSVDRARGFLVPEVVLTSNLATGLKLPYFIPMGMSSDVLITPYFSSKTNTLSIVIERNFEMEN